MLDPFLFCIFFIAIFMIAGFSIGLAMFCGSVMYLALGGKDISIATETMLQGLYHKYTLLAIPLFILAADIMNVGSIADRLLKFSEALVGRFRGGLGHVNVVSSLIFSGMSGSAIADAVGMGKIIIHMMTKNGKYPMSYAAAITAATATIGPIIPPSIPMVMYALISDASIGYLFAAGVFPGLLMAISMGITNALIARRRGFPVEPPTPLRDLPKVTWNAFPALMLPVILLGGIYGGVMTPTEAAAVAAFYALVISTFLYRSVSFNEFFQALIKSSKSTAAIGMLIAGALAFNYVLTREDIPDTVAVWLTQYDLSPTGFLFFVVLLMTFLGCVLEAGPILLVIVPIFVPAALAIGVDIIHLGIVVVVNAMVGLITPPVGMLLFIVANITKAKMAEIIRDVIPFIIVLFTSLFFITLNPDFVLFLPRLLGYPG
ncbi:MAG: permease [Crocinitomicaceae bacterium]|nr:permease [Crocinitomicaceae bacterium]